MQPPPQTVYVTSPAPTPVVRPQLAKKECLALGVTQLVFGIVCVLIDIILLALYGTHYGIAATRFQGMWAGVLAVVSGALGIAAARSDSRNLMMATGILSIFAAVFAFIGMCVAFSIAWPGGYFFRWQHAAISALATIQGILFLAEIAVAIAHSVVCFRPVCCSSVPQTTTTIITTTPVVQQGYVNPGMVYGPPTTQLVPGVHNVQHVQPGQPAQPQGSYGYAAAPISPPPYATADGLPPYKQ